MSSSLILGVCDRAATIIGDQKSFELICEDAEDCELWFQCFKNAGVYPEDPVRLFLFSGACSYMYVHVATFSSGSVLNHQYGVNANLYLIIL